MALEVYAVIAALVLLPVLGSALCLAIPVKGVRNTLVVLTTLILIAAAVYLATMVIQQGGRVEFSPYPATVHAISWSIIGIDLIVLLYVIARGLAARRFVSPALAVIQMMALLAFEVFGHVDGPHTPVVIDYLSLTLIMLASVIGPIILVYAMGYMDQHEAHLHLPKTKQPRFFAVLFLFLGVMNALAMADNMLWMYTFWEITTLCSFLLISHDDTTESIRNAFRTLDLNMLGGVAFIGGIIALYTAVHTISLQEITTGLHLDPSMTGLIGIGIVGLCVAGFTKSAQFPFQSWLLGAMVAPTPVSALLHSSTMVKAGVYLIVRLSPVLAGTLLGYIVAFAGGLTFMAASAIAISQSNGKRVLAYSTIANLGLIVCCAGIGTHAALGAAILLMVFHAISKGLLFLCIGTIEQRIGSRDIEDMQGLLKLMPFTTFVTVIGMVSMLLPPFGVLMTKWIAIEAAVHYPLVLMLIILGSAFTVVFWAKWIGIILTMSYKTKYHMEHLRPSMSTALLVLLLGALAASVGIAPLFNTLVAPHLQQVAGLSTQTLAADTVGIWLGTGSTTTGGVMLVPLFLIVFALAFAVPYFLYRTKPEKVKPPYFGGELANNDIRGIDFVGPGEKVEHIVVHNYYMAGIFGERSLSLGVGLIATAIILVMFGVSL